jgi:hypothetical protein
MMIPPLMEHGVLGVDNEDLYEEDVALSILCGAHRRAVYG